MAQGKSTVFFVFEAWVGHETLMIVTRFAPSPNGKLHIGHAYSAIVSRDLAVEQNGRFLLRIEDIDLVRSTPELIDLCREDLRWLGLDWEEVPLQSARLDTYQAAVERLKSMGLLYRCVCSRGDIARANPTMGAEGPIYPGICKGRDVACDVPTAWRLDVAAAQKIVGPLVWHDALIGEQAAEPELLGDVVIVQKEIAASYHLAVTVDDAADGVTLVTRGQDLIAATHIHRLLQALLDLAVPRWHHHRLILDQNGEKLAKRRGSQSLSDLREMGVNGVKLGTELRAGRLGSVNSLSKA